MKTFFLISSLALVSSTLFAATPDVWRGKGETRSIDNQPLKSYDMTVTLEPTASGSLRTKILVTAADGSKLFEDSCESTQGKTGGWRKICQQAQGGGYMLNDTLGTDYITDGKGRAWSTTIIMDGPKDMRLLRVELLNDKAQKWFVETLHKVD